MNDWIKQNWPMLIVGYFAIGLVFMLVTVIAKLLPYIILAGVAFLVYRAISNKADVS